MAVNPSLVSVILPCFDQLDFMRRCVAALARHTRPPWELVVVDNGSTDGTAAYLGGVRDVVPFRVEVLTNPENLGFPAAGNQRLKAAGSDHHALQAAERLRPEAPAGPRRGRRSDANRPLPSFFRTHKH